VTVLFPYVQVCLCSLVPLGRSQSAINLYFISVPKAFHASKFRPSTKSMYISPILVLCLARRVHAYTRFDTTCTVPSVSANFVSSPDTRGTLDILWSCLFTIIACTWTIQHLNIPEQRNNLSEKMERRRRRFQFREGETRFVPRLWYDLKDGARELWPDFLWGLGSFWTNLKWMLFTILAPEFILGKAIGDFFTVWKLQQRMEHFAMEDNVEWGLSHGFFGLIGGFRIRSFEQIEPQIKCREREVEESELCRQVPDIEIESDAQRCHQSPCVEKLNHLPAPGSAGNFKIDGENILDSYIVSGETICWLRQKGVIKRLPGITSAEIHDRGKSNIFAKVVAAAQVLWMAMQAIARTVKGLSVSPLELMTTAFSVCAILTYLFLLQKPQGVQTPQRPMEVILTSDLNFPVPDHWAALRAYFIPRLKIARSIMSPMTRIKNDYAGDAENMDVYLLGMAFGGAVFGAVHVAGWRLSFPTPVDREIWHVSSILMTCLLPIACLPLPALLIIKQTEKPRIIYNVFFQERRKRKNRHPQRWNRQATIQHWGFVFGILYIVARLILLIQTFRALAFLPPDAFVLTWASNIPNVS
jgi:hypothetical protein